LTLDVEVGGRLRRVSAGRDGGGWSVTLDGRTFRAEVAQVEGRWSLLLRPAGAGYYRSYEVAFEASGPGTRLVHVNGVAVAVTAADPRGLFGRRRDSGAGATAGGRITAPMPGRIVKVLVARGDRVAAGQGLVVVEAMKMENEVRAPKAGTVVDVPVTEGMSIDGHTLLVVLDAAP
jgi:biotin carboxyl carrier protein